MTEHLHYAGTSGHQAPPTSREHATTLDRTGHTRRMQDRVLSELARRGAHGLTVLEARVAFHVDNPNKVAPSFTNLHHGGHIERLDTVRGRHHVYVLPDHVNGRALAPATTRDAGETDERRVREQCARLLDLNGHPAAAAILRAVDQ